VDDELDEEHPLSPRELQAWKWCAKLRTGLRMKGIRLLRAWLAHPDNLDAFVEMLACDCVVQSLVLSNARQEKRRFRFCLIVLTVLAFSIGWAGALLA